MHFRNTRDEVSFGRLKAELVAAIGHRNVRDVNNILRLVGRIESMAFWEGVRQGFVASSLTSLLEEKPVTHPFKAHSSVYCASFTPLSSAEEKYIKEKAGETRFEALVDAFGLRGDLAPEPMEVPPMTLDDLPPEPLSSDEIKAIIDLNREESIEREALEMVSGQPEAISLIRTDGSVETTTTQQTHLPPIDSPSFVEVCRDAIQSRLASGWSPGSWSELVLELSVNIQYDPAFLDIALSSDLGRSMLDSIGLGHLTYGILSQEELSKIIRTRY